MSAAAQPSAAAQDVLSLQALLVARGWMYTLVHKLFGGEPTSELVDVLFGATTKDVLEEYEGDFTVMGSYRKHLEGLRASADDGLLESLRDEYTRCFIGPASLPAVPIASPHITHDRSAVQKRTLEVRELYRRHGLAPKKLQRVPDDHLSILCAFMAELAQRSLAALDAGDAAALAASLRSQKGIVAEHLDSWVAAYAKDLRRSSTHVLYPQTAEMLAAFLKADMAFLDEAAYWLEGNAGAVEGCAAAPGLDRVRAELAALGALRLFALEDNELVSLDIEGD